MRVVGVEHVGMSNDLVNVTEREDTNEDTFGLVSTNLRTSIAVNRLDCPAKVILSCNSRAQVRTYMRDRNKTPLVRQNAKGINKNNQVLIVDCYQVCSTKIVHGDSLVIK